MKKSLVKLAALTSAAFVLAGGFAPVVNAATQAEVDAAQTAFDTANKELADLEVAFQDWITAERKSLADLKENATEEDQKVIEDLENEFNENVKAKTKEVADKQAEVLTKSEELEDAKKALAEAEKKAKEEEEKAKEEAEKKARIAAAEKAAEDILDQKFETEEGAKARLDIYLANYKGVIHNYGEVVKEFDAFWVKLYVEDPNADATPTPETSEEPKPETPETSEEPKPETPETPEKDLDTVKKEALARLDLLKALTKAEVEHFTKAILNAESANEVAAIIKEAEDVNFSVNLEAETPAKEVKPEESKEGSKKEEKKEDKKEKLPETGEVSSFAIFGGAALSVLAGLGLVASKKEEK